MQWRNVLHDDLVMQLAILIEDESEYKGKKLIDYSGIMDDSIYCGGHSKIVDIYKEQEIEYLYFGNEFCEYRIPSIEQFTNMLMMCNREGIKLVLVTPPVSDYGIGKVDELLKYICDNDISVDIVVNDVGALELISQMDKSVHIILGRMFDKTSHDSRASMDEFDWYYSEEGMRYARTPGVISKYSKELYRNYGVVRYEFDLPKVGLELPKDGDFSLYWPYSYMTTGRVCMLRSLDLQGKNKFLVGNNGCRKLCMKYRIKKHKPVNGCVAMKGNSKKELLLIQRGNTIFYIDESSNYSLESFNRIVVQL